MFTILALVSALAAPSLESPTTWDTGELPGLPTFPGDHPVVNGTPVPEGRWPDAAYVVGRGGICTGTLIAPRWVMTAAHCVPGTQFVLLNAVDDSVAFHSDAALGQAERIRVVSEHYQRSDNRGNYDYDIALLELEYPSTVAPRVIAQDCVIDEDLTRGAKVRVVGWGATRADGNGNTDVLLEGETFVETKDCSAERVKGLVSGCNPNISPGGEIGAGGNGTDACFGDSGGPLYLPTERGTYLVGVTSRSYLGASQAFPCRDGGIYTRPDAVVAWVEEITGEQLPHPSCGEAPRPIADPLHAASGGKGRTRVDPNDADGGTHTYEIASKPTHGRATVDEKGVIVYFADKGYRGADSVTVLVRDSGAPRWPESEPATGTVIVPIDVGGCGCATGGPASSAWAAVLALLVVRRRR